MLKKLLCLLGSISFCFTLLCVYDLKLVNNYNKDIVIKLVTYDDLRIYKNPIISDDTPEVLTFPHPVKDLTHTFQNAYLGVPYLFTLQPRQVLVIEDFLDEERVAIAGTLLWKEIPLIAAKKLVETAKFRRLKEHGTQRLKEIQSAGGAAYAPPFRPQEPVKDMVTVIITPYLLGFGYKLFHKEVKEPTDAVLNAK